jgi:hypothetical protein
MASGSTLFEHNELHAKEKRKKNSNGTARNGRNQSLNHEWTRMNTNAEAIDPRNTRNTRKEWSKFRDRLFSVFIRVFRVFRGLIRVH